MIFVRAGNYYVESKCQHYTVSKVSLDAERYAYVAWFKAFAKVQALMLGITDSAVDAQGLCQGHFDSLADDRKVG